MELLQVLVYLTVLAAAGLGSGLNGIDYHDLPDEPAFPGPWDEYIKAPANKSFIAPARVWKYSGDVTLRSDGRILIGQGGQVTLEFPENIAGRVCFDIETLTDEPVLSLAYSESSFFVGQNTDATNDEEWDLPLDLSLGHQTGIRCVGSDFIRGGFKYLTLYIHDVPTADMDHESTPPGREVGLAHGAAQKILGGGPDPQQTPIREEESISKPSIGIKQIWVNCTSFPSQSNGRAYSGYFYSSSSLLNRIWYAGAYTLQLSTIDPKEGSALIPVNRFLDHNDSPRGSWYSNFTVSRGSVVTTDGAKRDRLVWPGDMYIAIPGIAVSTYDMLAIRNALDVMFERQYSDGRLPYAGPPLSYHNEFSDTYHLHTLLGTYFYVLYSGDIAWLVKKWPAYLRALRISISKVDSKNLMHVTSTYDWNRHGMGGHNIEATAILHEVLKHSAELVSFIQDAELADTDAVEIPDTSAWLTLRQRLEKGVEALYCPDTGLYSDNLGERHCTGGNHVDPQDGNSWALIAKMQNISRYDPFGISEALRARWTKFGAPAVEFPNVMSPFSSSFELQGHCAAGNHDAAVELMLLMWGYLLDGPGFTNSTLAEGFRTDGHVHYPAYPIPSRNSHAHGWAAGPTSVLVNSILGINLLKPGGEEWLIEPVITKWLSWVRGGFTVKDGSFEVQMRRVVLKNKKMGKNARGLVRKGVVATVKGPKGSKGRFRWSDQAEEDRFEVSVIGGETRTWIRWEDQNVRGVNMASIEELDIDETILAGRNDERWYEQAIPYKGSELVYDASYEEPLMLEREPGTVDWEALGQNYVTPVWQSWTK